MFQQTPQKRVLFPRALTPVMVGGFLACLVLFSILLSIFGAPKANAVNATNNSLNFQARLETNTGAIVPDGFYNVQFKLYDGDTAGGSAGSGVGFAGTNLWTETWYDSNGGSVGNDNRVQIKDGYLSVSLGSQNPFPSTINWDQRLWITMNIGGTTQTATPTWDGEMNPRLALTSVPYAFRAGQLATFNSGNGFTSSLSILQPTSGNQVFQIPDQGVAGTFSLCIANSSACGFALSSGNTNYIQNQNASAQTSSNFWISGTGHANIFVADTSIQAPLIDAATASTALNIGATSGGNANAINLNQNVTVASGVSFTANGPATFQGNVAQAGVFQVLTPTSTPLISVDTTTNNLVTNSSFEANITGWSAKVPTAGGGSSTLSQTSSQAYNGYASLQAITATAGGYGVQTNSFTSALTTGTPYELTFMARCSSSISTFTWGHQDVSGGTANDLNNTTGTCDTNWRRFTLHFTTGGTVTNPNIYMTTGTSTGITFWVDAVQVLQTSTSGAEPYSAGSVKIGGVITDAVVIRQPINSTNAFEVENAAGTGNNFVVDTVNSQVRINTTGYGSNLNVGGTSTFRTTSNSVNGFQIQNSSGWQLLDVDTTLPAVNLINNPGFESATTGWANKNSGALTRVTTANALYFGVAAGQLVTSNSVANSGTSFNVALTLSNTYTLSFYARSAGAGNVTGINFGYTNSGGDQDCQTGLTIVSGGFTRYTCTFTVTGAAGTAIYIRQPVAGTQTIYIDGFQLVAGSSAVPYSLGNIALRGTINSPVSFRNTNDSTTAFQIQNQAGTSNLFVADTLNNQIGVGGALNVAGDISGSGNLNIGGQTVITSGQVLQHVTADTSILNAGTLGVARGGTGVDGSSAANGQLLIGNGSGFTLSTLSAGSGISINNTAGAISISATANGAAGGDLTGTYPNPTIAKLQGSTLTITTPASNNILQYNGSAWVNTAISGDITITGGVAAISPGVIVDSDLSTGTFSHITGVGQLTAGSIASGFGTISTSNTIATTASLQGGGLTVGNTAGQQVTISAGANHGIEIGRTDGTSSTPFIDFHSGATATDYDARIIASGGTGASGGGTLTLTAGTTNVSGNLQINSTTVFTSGRVLQNVLGYTQSSGTATFNQNAADQFKILALQAPTTDMALISNSGKVITTGGINAQQIDYYAALTTASTEAASSRINITNTSTVASTVTDGIRLVVTSSSATGSTNALKVDNITGGSGTETAINLGTGYDNLLTYNGTQIINGTGILQSAGISGAYANLTGTGALDSGSITSNFGSINNGASGITTTGTLSGGTLNVGGTQRIDGSGNLSSIGTIDASGKITTTGDLTTGNQNTISFTRTIPTTVNNEVDLGSFAFTNGGANLQIDVTVPNSGYSQSKQYTVPVYYNATANVWQLVQPVSDTGAYSGNDISLEINVSNATASLRIRRVSGATAGTAYVTIKHQGVVGDAFTASSATSAVSAPTVYYGSSIAGSSAGTFTIQGNLTVTNSGGFTIGGQQVITSGRLLQNVTTDASIINNGTGTLNVNRGGTGLATVTSHGILYGNGTSAMGVTAAGTSGQILQANGSGVPGFVTMSGDVTIAAGGATSIGVGKVTTNMILDGTVSGTDIAGTTITNANLQSGSFGAITGVGTLGSLTVSGVITSTQATGTAPFSITSTTVVTNLNADMVDGQHASAFAAATGSTAYIQNQNASAQTTANFWISGSGKANGGFDVGTAGTLNLGNGTATAITLGSASMSGTLTVGQATVSNTINIGNAAVTGTQTVNIATGATGAGRATVTIGSTNDGSSLTLQGGTSGVVVNSPFMTTKDLVVGSPSNVGTINFRMLQDDFETGDFINWTGTVNGSGWTPNTTTVHNGKYAAQLTESASQSSLYSYLTGSSTVFGRTYFNVSTLGNPTYLMDFGTSIAGTPGNDLAVYLGGSGNLCYTTNLNLSTPFGTCSTTAPSTGAWHKLEVQVTVATSTTGVLQVYLDGSLISSLNLSNLNLGTTQLSYFSLSADNALTSNSTSTVYYDDVAVDTVPTGDSSTAYIQDGLHVSGNASVNTINIYGSNSAGNSIEAIGTIDAAGGFSSQGTPGATTSCTNGQALTNTEVSGGIITGGACANAVSTLQDAYDNTSQSSGGSTSTPASVAGREVTGTGASTANIAITAPSAGDVLVAVIGTADNTNPPASGVTGISGAGGTWKLAIAQEGNGVKQRVEIWYCYNCTTGGTVTVSGNANTTHITVDMNEYSGVSNTSDPLEVAAGQIGSTPASKIQTTPTIKTTTNNDLLVAGFSIFNSNVTSATTPTGFTALSMVTNSGKRTWADYDAGVAPGNHNASWTINASTSASGTAIAAFKPAVSGGSNIASILLADAKDYVITAPDTTTDPNVLVNLQCRTGCSTTQGRWAVQSNGIDALSVLYDPTTAITNVNIGSGVNLKLAADAVGNAQGAITHDFTCTSGVGLHKAVAINGSGSVGLTVANTLGDASSIGIVVAKPSSTICTVAIAGIVQASANGTSIGSAGDYVTGSGTAGEVRSNTTFQPGKTIGKLLTGTVDGNNLVWILIDLQ